VRLPLLTADELTQRPMNANCKQSFYAHGKLLLTGEYFVLEGARALALPVRLGQWLYCYASSVPLLQWHAYDADGTQWFSCTIDPATLHILSADANGPAHRLQTILEAAIQLNPTFRTDIAHTAVHTHLEFPRQWGFGSSATLLANLARWAQVDPFALLEASFGGSGYDLATAMAESPIIFWRSPHNGSWQPHWEPASFHPPFADQLWFIYLEAKQDSRQGIARFAKLAARLDLHALIRAISRLTDHILHAEQLDAFEEYVRRHEELVAQALDLKPVQQTHFPDYDLGVIKSLGAWGGDFVLATSRQGPNETRQWFAHRGYPTCLSWQEVMQTKKI